MKILVVEDSATLRATMKSHIVAIGHRPYFASSGEEALQLVGSGGYDMIIMDVEMPGLDGFETTRLIREILGDVWVPIIFVTSHTDDSSVLAGIEAGGDDYLIKPLTRAFLEAKLRALQRIAEMQKQLSRLNDELAKLSERDSLTKLYNRRAFNSRAGQSLNEAHRHGQRSSLIMLDVDHFKAYNDLYGHIDGDRCLEAISQCLADTVHRRSDLVARYGGEEFVIFLPETDQAGAVKIATDILNNVAECKLEHKGSSTAEHVTLSMGVVSSENLNDTLDTLLARADQLLYQAKKQGRNQWVTEAMHHHKTILIADDNNANVVLLTKLLKSLGNIISAENADECIQMALELQPDLILLDSDRTVINGPETIRALADSTETAAIPVLYLSESANDATELEMARHISKPVNVASLRSKVMGLLA